MYELKSGSDEFGCFVKCTGRLMEVEYLTVILDPNKDQEQIEKIKSKVPLCRFPVLEVG